ncbi:unnamed protein product, partial [Penicillium nalgiovense]
LHSLKSHDSMVLDSVIHVNGLFSDNLFRVNNYHLPKFCRRNVG